MSKHKPRHAPVVYVEWHDARNLASSWKDRDELILDAKRLGAERVVTAGFLLQKTKRYIIVAACHAPNDDVSNALLIPRSEIRVFRVVERQRGGKWT